MTESCLGAIWNNASSSELKQQKQFQLPAFSKEENRFFSKRHPLNKTLESRGCRQLQEYSFQRSDLSSFKAIKGNWQSKVPYTHKPPRTSEESSSWYRYVPRTFCNAHSFQATYIGQNSLFLSELAEHYKRPLVSGNCGGVHDRVSGISSPNLHSQHACIRGGERINRPESSLSNKNMLFTKF